MAQNSETEGMSGARTPFMFIRATASSGRCVSIARPLKRMYFRQGPP
jgi:hypothetical protein